MALETPLFILLYTMYLLYVGPKSTQRAFAYTNKAKELLKGLTKNRKEKKKKKPPKALQRGRICCLIFLIVSTAACDNLKHVTVETESLWGMLVKTTGNTANPLQFATLFISTTCECSRSAAPLGTLRHFPPISAIFSGSGGSILPLRKRQGWKKSSSFLQQHYQREAWCRKLLPQPNHYVYSSEADIGTIWWLSSRGAFSTCVEAVGEQHYLISLKWSSLHLQLLFPYWQRNSDQQEQDDVVGNSWPSLGHFSWVTSFLKKGTNHKHESCARQTAKLSVSRHSGTAASHTHFKRPQLLIQCWHLYHDVLNPDPSHPALAIKCTCCLKHSNAVFYLSSFTQGPQ